MSWLNPAPLPSWYVQKNMNASLVVTPQFHASIGTMAAAAHLTETPVITASASRGQKISASKTVTPTITGSTNLHPAVVHNGLSVTPSMSASAHLTKHASGSLTVTPSFVAAMQKLRFINSVLNITPTISGAATVAHHVSASLTETPTISGTASRGQAISASKTVTPTTSGTVHLDPGVVHNSLSITPTLSASAALTKHVSGALNVTPTITAVISKERFASASLNVTPTISAAGLVTKHASASLTETPTFTGVIHLDPGVMHASETITPTITGVVKYHPGLVSDALTVTPSISAGAHRTTFTSPSLTVTPTLSASAVRKTSTSPSLTVTPTLSASVAKTIHTSPTLSVTPTFAATAKIGVSYDSTGAGSTGGTNSFSWSHTIGSGANYIVVAFMQSTYQTPTSVKVGTTSCTLLAKEEITLSFGVYLYGLASPPTGAQTIAVVLPSSVFFAGNSVAYKNVNSVGTGVNATGSGNPSLGVTSGSLHRPVFIAGSNNGGGSFSSFSGTSRWNDAFSSGVNYPSMFGDAAGASTVTFTATNPGGTYGVAGVDLST